MIGRSQCKLFCDLSNLSHRGHSQRTRAPLPRPPFAGAGTTCCTLRRSVAASACRHQHSGAASASHQPDAPTRRSTQPSTTPAAPDGSP
eukprot:3210463-Pleurochrysis_carterae.AAC.1